jgi:hypothetical protein
MIDCNLTIKDNFHDLTTKLCLNNEKNINTLGILWILIMCLMLTPEPQIFQPRFER